MRYIKWFDTVGMQDVPQVGGKNASIGEMIRGLHSQGIAVPRGFAITADAYWYFLEHNKLQKRMRALIKQLNPKDMQSLQRVGRALRASIISGTMPQDLSGEIEVSYKKLCAIYKQTSCDVAVRSSATAEDLPTASFAGQQETYLNVRGNKALLEACKKSMASLFTDRAIIYRIEKGFDHFQVALSVGVQKMVRSDKACAGVAFSLDTETGFKDVVMIDAAFGLGESIVKGLVNPDEYFVFKPTLEKGFDPIIKKRLGTKKLKIIYGRSSRYPVKQVAVAKSKQHQFVLRDEEVLELARMVNTIDKYYSRLHKRWMPMDVEWAKDGIDGKIYIVQARPETVHAQRDKTVFKTYAVLKPVDEKRIVTTGASIGQQIATGIARVIRNVKDLNKVKEGDIIVTTMTDPDWVPVMKRAAGIVTDLGGRTCHAAIVSRELDRPAIVGTNDGTKRIQNGKPITIDCSQGAIGYVYEGIIPFEVKETDLKTVPKAPVDIMVNIANPDNAFTVGKLPVAGVGLARIEFIITNTIKIHPMALLRPKSIQNKKERKKIEELVAAYPSKQQFFIDTLAQGIGMIAAAFYPRPVIVRLSDFKTNEYRNLIGGTQFEPEEANPMLGFRGASRYTHELYQDAFCLESSAVQKVREGMGFDNVMVMLPFVRTVDEAKRVVDVLSHCGLRRHQKELKLVMMCEVPSNVIMIDEFSRYFDGFSIGSNDLTQLTLGVDRDSALLANLFDERNPAVKKMFVMAIEGAHRNKRFIGICGQAPSDYPELAEFLIEQGIDSISLNPDSVLPFLLRYQ